MQLKIEYKVKKLYNLIVMLMKNKKGFISMTLLYSFFIVFIAILLAIISNYVHNGNLLRQINNEIRESLENRIKEHN